MKKTEFEKIFELEESHWWYVGTREIAYSVLDQEIKGKDFKNIYDVGCGTGGNMVFMQKYGKVEGSDIDKYAVEFTKSKGLNAEVMDMTKFNPKENSYDLVTFFEVLNQVTEDRMPPIIRNVYKGLKPGGIIMLREPAMKLASGNHDLDVNTQKRFEKSDMTELLEQAGFSIRYISYVNSLLFLPIVVVRKLQQLLSLPVDSDVQKHSPFMNSLYLNILRIEKNLLKFMKFPFGISILVIAEKK